MNYHFDFRDAMSIKFCYLEGKVFIIQAFVQFWEVSLNLKQ